ncbi:MAG: AzlC family ABC transporter permease [Actinomycetota bacterium]
MTVERRREIVRDAVGIGVATGAYGLSFGALSMTAGLSLAQTCALSLLMFTGASQFALVGVVGAGGAWVAAAASAVLLGTRNALYGLRMAPVLDLAGGRRLAGSHLVIDESTAMGIAHEESGHGPLGFFSTGLAVFVFWNLGTLLGALGARVIPAPETLGLDAAVPAAFIGLLAPRLKAREPWAIAAAAASVALVLTPLLPVGVPVIASALVAIVAGARARRSA